MCYQDNNVISSKSRIQLSLDHLMTLMLSFITEFIQPQIRPYILSVINNNGSHNNTKHQSDGQQERPSVTDNSDKTGNIVFCVQLSAFFEAADIDDCIYLYE